MYWRIWDLWSLANFVASMVTELDDTSLCLMDVHWNSVEVTHRFPSRCHVEGMY
jgi:hypothetical protein